MEFSSLKLEKLLIFQKETLQIPKNKQKICSEEISCLMRRFCNFTEVKHKEILSENSLGKFLVKQK